MCTRTVRFTIVFLLPAICSYLHSRICLSFIAPCCVWPVLFFLSIGNPSDTTESHFRTSLVPRSSLPLSCLYLFLAWFVWFLAFWHSFSHMVLRFSCSLFVSLCLALSFCRSLSLSLLPFGFAAVRSGLGEFTPSFVPACSCHFRTEEIWFLTSEYYTDHRIRDRVRAVWHTGFRPPHCGPLSFSLYITGNIRRFPVVISREGSKPAGADAFVNGTLDSSRPICCELIC